MARLRIIAFLAAIGFPSAVGETERQRSVLGGVALKEQTSERDPSTVKEVVTASVRQVPRRLRTALVDRAPAMGKAMAVGNSQQGSDNVALADKPAMGKMAAASNSQGGGEKKKKKKGSVVPTQEMVDRWLTWTYWKPLALSMGWLVASVEVAGPMLDAKLEFGLVREVVILATSIYGMAAIIIFTLDMAAAGMLNLLAVATIGCTMAMLLVIFTISVKVNDTDKNDPVMLLATDVAGLLRPILRLILVGVVLDVVAKEASVDWGQLAVLAGYLMLGIALSLSGVIGDVLGHVFIRMDNHFREGDFIVYDGGVVQVDALHWRHTIALTSGSQCKVYIPNSELTSAAIVNQSQDTDRVVEVDIPVDLEADKLKEAVKNAWDLFKQAGTDDFSFTALDGKTYKNQFNIDECECWVKESCDAIHVTFVGQYFYSNPPPYIGKGVEMEKVFRQQEWEHGWQMQVEWYSIQLKRMNEKLGDWPFRAD
jgi:small-conductance mechanosensitive channel